MGPVNLVKNGPTTVNVFVRPADTFSFVDSSNDPGICTTLGADLPSMQGRAGHTATVLAAERCSSPGASIRRARRSRTWTRPRSSIRRQVSSLRDRHHAGARVPHGDSAPGTTLTVIAGGENEDGAVETAEIYDRVNRVISV